MHGQTQIKFVS